MALADQLDLPPFLRALAGVRARTGLSHDQIATMLGVSRQTIHLWQRGGRSSDAHARRLLGVQDVLSRAARYYPTPELLRTWLNTPRGSDGRTPMDLLAAGEIDRARLLAMAPIISPRISPLPAVLREPTPPAMQAGRESRMEAYADERADALEDLCADDRDELADEE